MTAAWIDHVAWPAERVGDALATLATHAHLAPRAVEVPRLTPPAASPVAWLDEAVFRFAAWLDVDAEPVGCALVDLDALLARAAPGIVRLDEGGRVALLAVARTSARHVTFLAPGGALVRRPLADLRDLLQPAATRAGAPELDAMLDRARVPAARRARAAAALLRERFSHARVEGVWILRRPPSAPFVAQLRGAGVLRLVAGLGALHLAETALFAGSWWILGRTALAGHLDPGWLAAWALCLLCNVPLHALAARLEGTIAIEAGVLLKRRLLAGALCLDADETRADGVGRMLSRVLESELIEQLALDAGGAILFTAIELVVAAVVLALGAAPLAETLLLAALTAVGVALGRALYGRRASWTDARLAVTHDMVERLVGHRTRIAQEPRAEWHDAEDQGVSRALSASKRLDRASVALSAVLPRAWLVLGLAVLSVALVTGPRELGGAAVTIGGVLVAFRAFRRGAQGAQAVAGALVAWRRVEPLFAAATRVEPPPSPRVVVQRDEGTERTSAGGEALVEARDLSFGYPSRHAPVLSALSLRVGPADRVLLLGPSGGGKSTLGALLAGLRRPTSGLLLLDGLDGPTLGLGAWRRRVASAPQFHDNHVLGATFAFNLLMGRSWPPEEADLDEAERLCRELDLGPLLERMPAGLLQMVGETGWQLSHGERSRLFLARALLQRADLVVLDESFAALDPATLAKAVACARRRARALVVVAHP